MRLPQRVLFLTYPLLNDIDYDYFDTVYARMSKPAEDFLPANTVIGPACIE